MDLIELCSIYDIRKSFYGKAKIGNNGNRMVLLSYGIEVAEIVDRIPKIFNFHSTTTTRHIKEFLKQNGFKAENKKQMEKDYMKGRND